MARTSTFTLIGKIVLILIHLALVSAPNPEQKPDEVVESKRCYGDYLADHKLKIEIGKTYYFIPKGGATMITIDALKGGGVLQVRDNIGEALLHEDPTSLPRPRPLKNEYPSSSWRRSKSSKAEPVVEDQHMNPEAYSPTVEDKPPRWKSKAFSPIIEDSQYYGLHKFIIVSLVMADLPNEQGYCGFYDHEIVRILDEDYEELWSADCSTISYSH